MNALVSFQAHADWPALIDCASTLVAQLPETLVTSNAGDAQELLGDIVKLKNQIDKERKRVKEPFLDAGKMVDSEANKLIKPLGELENRVRSRLSDYSMRIEAEQREALAEQFKAEQAAKADTSERSTPSLVASAAVIIPVSAELKTRSYPVLVIDYSTLPREYWLPDEAKIRAALDAGTAVEGAKIVMEKRVVAR